MLEQLTKNVLDHIYTDHPLGSDLLRIDLEELVRQQQERIDDLELEVQNLEDLVTEQQGTIDDLEAELLDTKESN